MRVFFFFSSFAACRFHGEIRPNSKIRGILPPPMQGLLIINPTCTYAVLTRAEEESESLTIIFRSPKIYRSSRRLSEIEDEISLLMTEIAALFSCACLEEECDMRNNPLREMHFCVTVTFSVCLTHVSIKGRNVFWGVCLKGEMWNKFLKMGCENLRSRTLTEVKYGKANKMSKAGLIWFSFSLVQRLINFFDIFQTYFGSVYLF